MVRFMSAPKQVNQNWAVNLIAEVPPKEVTERVVWCDGGSGPEGHPRVYINLVSIFNITLWSRDCKIDLTHLSEKLNIRLAIIAKEQHNNKK